MRPIRFYFSRKDLISVLVTEFLKKGLFMYKCFFKWDLSMSITTLLPEESKNIKLNLHFSLDESFFTNLISYFLSIKVYAFILYSSSWVCSWYTIIFWDILSDLSVTRTIIISLYSSIHITASISRLLKKERL